MKETVIFIKLNDAYVAFIALLEQHGLIDATEDLLDRVVTCAAYMVNSDEPWNMVEEYFGDEFVAMNKQYSEATIDSFKAATAEMAMDVGFALLEKGLLTREFESRVKYKLQLPNGLFVTVDEVLVRNEGNDFADNTARAMSDC